MPEFWVASGHHLTRLDDTGRMVVTDELILAWLARPEVLPPPEACAVERTLHKRLMNQPRAKVSEMELIALQDPDARENWRFLLALRDRLIAAGTVEEGYARIVQEEVTMPSVFMSQLVQLILRNALDGCSDPQVLRAAECFFRPQRSHVQNDNLFLADEELVQLLEQEMHSSPLTAMLSGGIEGLDVLSDSNDWTYWSRSDAHTMVMNFGGDAAARMGMATAISTFVRHMLLLDCTVTAQTSAENIDLRWFVGLDQAGTAIGNALWNKQPVPATLVGLFRIDIADHARVAPDLQGQPIWLFLGLGADGAVRIKPQNLLTGLPLAAPALN